jgi:hypothetical protein
MYGTAYFQSSKATSSLFTLRDVENEIEDDLMQHVIDFWSLAIGGNVVSLAGTHERWHIGIPLTLSHSLDLAFDFSTRTVLLSSCPLNMCCRLTIPATALSYFVYTDESQGLPVLWCFAGFLIGFFVNVSAMEIVSASVSTFFVCFAEVHATEFPGCLVISSPFHVCSALYVIQDPSALQPHQPTLSHMTHEVWRRLHGDLHIGPGL